MKLRLNLSTAPLENKRPFLAGAVLLGSIAAIALVFLSHAAYLSWRSNRALRTDIAYWEGEIRANRQKQRDLEAYFRGSQPQQVLDRAAFLNSLIQQRSFPWTKVFMDLERTLPPGVRVVNISPRLDKGRAEVNLTIGAANDEGKIQFLKALENSKVFFEIEVKEERHEDQAASADKVVLQLTAWYSTT
jgi:Tfp pilus assembly protein PilN